MNIKCMSKNLPGKSETMALLNKQTVLLEY